MIGSGRRPVVARVASAMAVSAVLLAGAGCSSSSRSTTQSGVTDVVGTAVVLRGAGPGEKCQPASPSSVQSVPTINMPKVAPHHLVLTDIKVGKGPEARAGQTVTVQYVGVACSTGTQFDATWDRGQPYTTVLRAPLMQGWVLGIPGMRVGGQRQLVIPPSLGYGVRGYKKAVRSGETLVYVIELQAIR